MNVGNAQASIYNQAVEEFGSGKQASTGLVTALRNFSAIPIRDGDDPDTIRGTETIYAGEVVKLRVQGQSEHQNAGLLAWLMALGRFKKGYHVQDEHGVWYETDKKGWQAARKAQADREAEAEKVEAERRLEALALASARAAAQVESYKGA